MRKIFLIIFLLINSFVLFAGNYEITTYPLQSKYLLSKQKVFQAKDGRIWVSEIYGTIFVYDGKNWIEKNYNPQRNPDSLFVAFLGYDNDIYGLSKLSNTLYKFDNNKFIKIKHVPAEEINNNFVSPDFISSNKFNGQEHFVIGSKNKIIHYIDDDFKFYNLEIELPDLIITDVKIIEDIVYFVCNYGLYTIKNGIIKKTELTGINLYDRLLAFSFSSEHNQYLLLSYNWIGEIKDGHVNIISKFEKRINHQDSRFRFYYLNRFDDLIVFGSPYSLHHYNTKMNKIISLEQSDGLIANGCADYFVDRENNHWVACMRGVSKLVGKKFRTYNVDDGLFENEAVSIIQNQDDIIIGHNSGFSIIGKNGISKLSIPGKKIHTAVDTRVFDLQKTEYGEVLASCSKLGIIRLKDNKIYYDKNIVSNPLHNGLYLDDKEHYWASTSGGVIVYDKNLNQVEFIDTEKYSARVRNIVPYDNENLLVLGVSDLFLLNKKNHKLSKILDEYISVYNVIRYKNGFLLAAKNGLYEYNPDKRILEPFNEELTDCSVYFANFDKNKNLWIGTNKGVYIKTIDRLIHFTTRDGLPANEVNRNAFLEDNEGKIWIGTSNGIMVFDSVPTVENKIKPIIDIISLSDLNNVIISKDSIVYLDNNQNNFIIDFRGISFQKESMNEFEITIKNINENSEVKFLQSDTKYKFINQQPGQYKFIVRVKNYTGVWSDIKSISISIDQPYYQKSWFILLLVGFISSIFFMIQKYYSKKLYAADLENEVFERTRSLTITNKKYQVIAETIGEVILGFDNSFRLNFVSPTCRTLLGVEQSLLYRFDKKHSLFDVVNEKYCLISKDEVKTGKCRKEVKIQNLKEEKVLEISSSPIITETGFEGFICLLRDITNLRKEEKSKTFAILNSVEKERARIARDLHDHIGQIIASIKLRLDILNMNSEFNEHLEAVNDQVGIVKTEIRNIINDLSDIPGNKNFFCESLQDYCEMIFRKTNFNFKFESNYIQPVLSEEEKLMIFRVLQETLNNAVKHSEAKNISVKAIAENGKFILIIDDDGKGFNSSTKSDSEKYGLTNIKQRIDLLDGEFLINSKKGIGTNIKIVV